MTHSEVVSKEVRATQQTSWPSAISIAVAIFFLVVTEFLPVGMMTPIATGLGVSDGSVGLTVTGPGLMGAIAAPALMLAARSIDRRYLIIFTTALIVLSNIVCATAPNLIVMILGRFLLGIGVGGLWTFAVPVARRLVAENMGSKVTALVAAGISVGTIVSIPAGAILGDLFGWRAAFWILAVFGAGLLATQIAILPKVPATETLTVRHLLALFGVRKARLGLVAIAFVSCGHFAAYTYLEPFLRTVPKLSQDQLIAALFLYGLCGVAGTFVGERAASKGTRRAFAGAALLVAVAVLCAALLGTNAVCAYVFVAIWGVAFGAVPVCIQIWMYEAAPKAFEGGSALFVSVFQVALAGGAFIGGQVVDSFSVVAAFLLASALSATAAFVIGVLGGQRDDDIPSG